MAGIVNPQKKGHVWPPVSQSPRRYDGRVPTAAPCGTSSCATLPETYAHRHVHRHVYAHMHTKRPSLKYPTGSSLRHPARVPRAQGHPAAPRTDLSHIIVD